MPNQFWVATQPPYLTADGTALASSTTLTDVSAAPQLTVPANYIHLNTRIQLDADLTFSTTGTPTLLLGFYYGGVAGSALAASSAITTGSGAASWSARLTYSGKVTAVGSSGSIIGHGTLDLGTSLTAFTTRPIPEVAASRTVTIDTTAAKALTVGAQWGTSSASNTITCNNFVLTWLN